MLAPLLMVLQYVMYCNAVFLDDIIFSYYGANGHNQYDVVFRRSLPGGDTSGMSDSYSVWSGSSECGTRGNVCCLHLTSLMFVRLHYTLYIHGLYISIESST